MSTSMSAHGSFGAFSRTKLWWPQKKRPTLSMLQLFRLLCHFNVLRKCCSFAFAPNLHQKKEIDKFYNKTDRIDWFDSIRFFDFFVGVLISSYNWTSKFGTNLMDHCLQTARKMKMSSATITVAVGDHVFQFWLTPNNCLKVILYVKKDRLALNGFVCFSSLISS